jgi:hypothetical protein
VLLLFASYVVHFLVYVRMIKLKFILPKKLFERDKTRASMHFDEITYCMMDIYDVNDENIQKNP